MMIKNVHKVNLLIIFLLYFLLTSCANQKQMKWNEIIEPTKEIAEVYGGYTAGCLDGGVALKASSNNYQAMRTSRQRYYGHPNLVEFLNKYSDDINKTGFGVLAIGDMSQARGGPMPGGHSSHQIGLDADIWFKRFTLNEHKKISLYDTESLSAVSMVSEDALTMNDNTWLPENISVLKKAAEYPEVERIFVNYVIKKELCATNKGEAWLRKIRPWWGHQYHYHVRLACPENSQNCKNQTPVEKNDGCNETLDWWFSEEAKIKLSEPTKKIKIKKAKILPSQCEAVFNR